MLAGPLRLEVNPTCEETPSNVTIHPFPDGGIAQLVERLVRNEKARGSNPLTSTSVGIIR
jgi:hypothetical protein